MFQFQAKNKVIASSPPRVASGINMRKDRGSRNVVAISASSALNQTHCGGTGAIATNQ